MRRRCVETFRARRANARAHVRPDASLIQFGWLAIDPMAPLRPWKSALAADGYCPSSRSNHTCIRLVTSDDESM
jgi:hypothetical protein